MLKSLTHVLLCVWILYQATNHSYPHNAISVRAMSAYNSPAECETQLKPMSISGHYVRKPRWNRCIPASMSIKQGCLGCVHSLIRMTDEERQQMEADPMYAKWEKKDKIREGR